MKYTIKREYSITMVISMSEADHDELLDELSDLQEKLGWSAKQLYVTHPKTTNLFSALSD